MKFYQLYPALSYKLQVYCQIKYSLITLWHVHKTSAKTWHKLLKSDWNDHAAIMLNHHMSIHRSSSAIKCRENQLSFSLVQILQKIFLLLFFLSSSTAISHIWTRSSHIKWLGGKGTNIKNKEKLLVTFSSTHSRSFCLHRIRQYFCHNFWKGFYTSLQLQKAEKL